MFADDDDGDTSDALASSKHSNSRASKMKLKEKQWLMQNNEDRSSSMRGNRGKEGDGGHSKKKQKRSRHDYESIAEGSIISANFNQGKVQGSEYSRSKKSSGGGSRLADRVRKQREKREQSSERDDLES
mmetsp:Transcript_26078/g.34874  ORF Transcript_26078/g.34874 Transcript_26078/m.34874 type:complete len:129 (+) Transcript_26078:2831-3217(+)